MEYKYSFERLEVWQLSRAYVAKVYEISTTLFPPVEIYALGSQIQRAAVSISSNIAEGVSRKTPKEQLRFLEMAYASLMETYNQWYIALDIHYIDENTFNELRKHVDRIANKINAFSRSIKEREAKGERPAARGEISPTDHPTD